MPAGSFTFAPQATVDLDRIWDYIADDNEPAADRMVDRLYATAGNLAQFPGIGRPRPELLADARSFAVDKIVIVYRATESGIEILRFVHGARDIESLF